MKLINNPFVTYRHKDAEYFCDRQKEDSYTHSIPLQTRSSDCSLFASQLFCNHCYYNSRCKRKTEHAVTFIAP